MLWMLDVVYIYKYICYGCWMSLWILQLWILPEHVQNLPGKFRLLEFDYIGSLFTPATLCHMHMLEHCCYWCWMSLWMLRRWILPEHFRNFPGKFRLLEFWSYWQLVHTCHLMSYAYVRALLLLVLDVAVDVATLDPAGTLPEPSRKVPIIGILIILATISHLPTYVICICQSSVVIGVGCRCGCCNSGPCRNTSRTFQESSYYSSRMSAAPEYYYSRVLLSLQSIIITFQSIIIISDVGCRLTCGYCNPTFGKF